MKTVIGLTDFTESEASRGRYKGTKSSSRKVVACDNWNWVIGLDNGKTVISERFYGNLKTLLPVLRNEFSAISDFKTFVGEFAKKIGELLNVQIVIGDIDTAEQQAEFGLKLDREHQLSFIAMEHPPKVTQRLFGAADEE